MIAWNEAAEAIFGWTRQEVLGRCLADVLPRSMSDLTRAEVRKALQDRAELQAVIEQQRQDGSVIYLETTSMAVTSPSGEVTGYVHVGRDITRRRQTELALSDSEARFRAIFERAGMGIAMVDRDGYVNHSNLALQDMLGYTGVELQAMAMAEYTHPEDLEIEKALFGELMAGEREFYRLDKRYVRKDGRIVWGALTVTRVCGPDGKPLFAIKMVKDISARKGDERALWLRTERLLMLHEIDRAVLAAQSPADIAQAAVQRFRRVIPSALAGVVLFNYSTGQALIPRVGH